MRATRLGVAAVVGAVVVAAVFPARAQTIYRCGNTYTRVPCSNGRALDIGQPTTAAQRAEARAVAARERRLAADMKHDRLADEARLRPASAASLGPAPSASKPAAAVKAKKRGAAKPKPGSTASGDFVARQPVQPPEAKRPPPN